MKVVAFIFLVLFVIGTYATCLYYHVKDAVYEAENCREYTALTMRALADYGIPSYPVWGECPNGDLHCWTEIRLPLHKVISINNGQLQDMSDIDILG